MEEFRSRTERLFFEKVTEFLKDNRLENRYFIVHEPRLKDYTSLLSRMWVPDFLILKGKYPFVIVEVQGADLMKNPGYREHFDSKKDILKRQLPLTGAQFLVFTDLEHLSIYDVRSNEERKDLPFESFFSLFKDELTHSEVEELKLDVSNRMKDFMLSASVNENIRKLFAQDLTPHIEYDKDGDFFHFKIIKGDGLENFENQFFQNILERVSDEVVCRYTTLQSLFQTILSKAYRLGSNIAMNDRGEIDYVDKYLGFFYQPISSMSFADVRNLNRSFISSCTTIDKQDDLTMYRLYGDDSKGVCLRLAITYGLENPSMIIRKVSYGESRDSHSTLDLIRDFVNYIEVNAQVTFKFMYLSIWKHFFKSSDYKTESEVRLLYFENPSALPDKKGWVMTNTDSIVSRYVLMDLINPQFPIKISSIILGPNCPEKVLNKRQLEQLLNEQGFHHVQVKISEIESYRKS